MANRTRKKPAARKPARSVPAAKKGRFGMVGWAATIGVAGAWAVSDGRPLAYLQAAVPGIEAKVPLPAIPDRVASLIDSNRATKPVEPRRERPAPAAAATRTDQTGSVHPVSRPVPPRPIIEVSANVPRPQRAPLVPFEKPMLEPARRELPKPAAPLASEPSRAPPVSAPASAPVAGVERHATRTLVAHAGPDGGSPRLGEVGAGSSVTVLRSAGDWRYVRISQSGVEGWIDGRYLAGESGPVSVAPELATVSQRDMFRRPD